MEEQWKEELKGIMLKGDSEIFSSSGVEFRKVHCPNMLYKYCSYTDYNLDSLKNEYLYMSDIQKVNDPLECFIEAGKRKVEHVKKFFDYWEYSKILFPTQAQKNVFLKKIEDGATFKSTFLDLLLDKLPGVYPYFAANRIGQERLSLIDDFDTELTTVLRNEIYKNIYIGCLSSEKDLITMWSYYANNHKGFVIEYEITDEIKKYCFPAFYTTQPINYDLLAKNKCITYLLCLKFKEWENEREWRIIRPSRQGHKLPLKVNAVYFGLRSFDKFDEKQSIENTVKMGKIINDLQIPTYKMALDKSNYKLVSIPAFKPKNK